MSEAIDEGTLLVATLRTERDPNFRRSVALVVEHDDEQGTFGVVVNKPLGELVSHYDREQLASTAEQVYGSEPADDAALGRMFLRGGPVEPGALLLLHDVPEIPGCQEVADGVCLGGDQEMVRSQVAQGPGTASVRLCLGYAGWAAGQLEQEIEHGGWVVCPQSAGVIFDAEPEALWERILYTLGDPYRWMAMAPENPRTN